MYSPVAEASIKDLKIKDNKGMVHREKSYKENNVLRLLLKEVIESIQTISLGKEFQSLVELTKKRFRKNTVLAMGCK